MPKYIAFLFMFLLLIVPNARADDDGGYDINTEITLSGTVTEAGEQMRGPRVFTMVSAEKTYKVVTGPWWYMKQIGLSIKTGMKLEVTGSKFYGRKGELYIAAFSITDLKESKTYRFRDASSQERPLWHGHGGGMRRQ
ncbi:MAG: hypothetical protein HQL01_01725 [Nitrospirae bacterium]|nr:hypothetical protein [Nitrospirota bacterium]